MTWSKTETRAYVADLAGRKAVTDWLFETFLPSKGWTCSWTEETGDDKFFAMTRPLTLQDGSVQQFNLVYEVEHASYDLLIASWNGSDDYTAWVSNSQTMVSDTNWSVLTEASDLVVWEDDASDAFMILKGNTPFAFQFPDGGWRPQPVNTGVNAGSRPFSCVPPVQEKNAFVAFSDASSAHRIINCVVASDSAYWNYGVWQDYTAMGVVTSSLGSQIVKAWEDLTNTWKMKAEALVFSLSPIQVGKIDSQYYIDIGPFLLPAGTEEPTI